MPPKMHLFNDGMLKSGMMPLRPLHSSMCHSSESVRFVDTPLPGRVTPAADVVAVVDVGPNR